MVEKVVFWLLLSAAIAINSTLPELVKRNYRGTHSRIVNVTVGERFSLPLPNFDSQWNPDHFQVYHIQEQEFKAKTATQQTAHTTKQPAASTTLQASQKTQSSSKAAQQQKPLGMDYIPLNCSLVDGASFISQSIKSVREQYSRVQSTRWHQNSYVLLYSKSLLYILNAGQSELTAYHYNDHTIEKIISYKLDQFINREDQVGELSISPPTIAASSSEETLYLFTALGVWEVKTKTVLSNVRPIPALSQFNSAKIGGIDKVLHGESGLLVGLKRSSKQVFIMQQPSADSTIKYKYKQITTFKQILLFPQDIAIIGNTLYILDFYKGVFIYSIMHEGEPVPRSVIAFDSFAGNFQFRVYSNSLFINFNDVQGSKIAEISVDVASESYNLVRYIKSDDFINILKVFSSVPTEYYLQPTRQKYQEDYMDSFLFLVQNYEDIEIYPFNIDPRMINRAYNALKLKGSQVKEIFHIAADRYIIVSKEFIQYIKITILKPSITCQVKKPETKAPQNYYRLAITSNISTCEHKDHNIVGKRYFNELCEMTTDFYIHIGDPQQSQYQKALLYAIVVGMVICFVIGLLCLMQWRNNKMAILGRLKSEIVNFRNRHKRIQPSFVEQNAQQKDIEIDIPQVSAVLQT